jgi:hypothetical protein
MLLQCVGSSASGSVSTPAMSYSNYTVDENARTPPAVINTDGSLPRRAQSPVVSSIYSRQGVLIAAACRSLRPLRAPRASTPSATVGTRPRCGEGASRASAVHASRMTGRPVQHATLCIGEWDKQTQSYCNDWVEERIIQVKGRGGGTGKGGREESRGGCSEGVCEEPDCGVVGCCWPL